MAWSSPPTVIEVSTTASRDVSGMVPERRKDSAMKAESTGRGSADEGWHMRVSSTFYTDDDMVVPTRKPHDRREVQVLRQGRDLCADALRRGGRVAQMRDEPAELRGKRVVSSKENWEVGVSWKRGPLEGLDSEAHA